MKIGLALQSRPHSGRPLAGKCNQRIYKRNSSKTPAAFRNIRVACDANLETEFALYQQGTIQLGSPFQLYQSVEYQTVAIQLHPGKAHQKSPNIPLGISENMPWESPNSYPLRWGIDART
ncbi:hypothetical protein [Methylocaldum marinum]|uniref:hypothetical protein n=1 Tax=Methylocaldum marinum TaxID=1432792 RepID=UPI0011AE8570|nr:hypothetical protein [Methylocaldum marinum]